MIPNTISTYVFFTIIFTYSFKIVTLTLLITNEHTKTSGAIEFFLFLEYIPLRDGQPDSWHVLNFTRINPFLRVVILSIWYTARFICFYCIPIKSLLLFFSFFRYIRYSHPPVSIPSTPVPLLILINFITFWVILPVWFGFFCFCLFVLQNTYTLSLLSRQRISYYTCFCTLPLSLNNIS